MPSDTGETRDPIEHCKEVLRDAGVRVTHQRLEIFREVVNSPNHPDAETVFSGVRDRVPTVSLDTVYRTLWLLTDLRLITTVGLPHERFRFDGNMRPHHHFVCVGCSLIKDFYSQQLDQLSLADAVREFGVPHTVQVEVRGLCWECLCTNNPAESDQ